MFTPVHHDLEGLAAERFRSLAAQLSRLKQRGAPAARLDALSPLVAATAPSSRTALRTAGSAIFGYLFTARRYRSASGSFRKANTLALAAPGPITDSP